MKKQLQGISLILLAILFMNVFAPLIDYFVVQSNIKRREKRLLKTNN